LSPSRLLLLLLPNAVWMDGWMDERMCPSALAFVSDPPTHTLTRKMHDLPTLQPA